MNNDTVNRPAAPSRWVSHLYSLFCPIHNSALLFVSLCPKYYSTLHFYVFHCDHNCKKKTVHFYVLHGVPIYRVFDPPCHPQISLCPRLQKNERVLNWSPKKTYQKWQSSQSLVMFGVSSSGLSHFREWPVQDLSVV